MIRLWIFAVLLPLSVWAEGPFSKLPLTNVICGPQALSLLQQWKAKDEWRLKFSVDVEEKKYQSPTDEFGTWVQIQWRDGKELKLSQFSEKKQSFVRFDSQCEPILQTQVTPRRLAQVTEVVAPAASGLAPWTDKQIEKILKEKKSAVFFLWTPHMQVSVEALREIQAATQKLKVPLYALVEPNSNAQSAKSIAKKIKVPASQVFYLDSFELSLRDFRLHFPSLIVVSKGQFSSPVQRGLESAEVYEDYIRAHL
ncbi:MAG: hypothetical protein ACAH59_13615 [Pseudobdellovibrionaceae bacterium]